MSKKLTLQNFIQMNPDVPQYGSKNQHYLISGVDPLYYLAQSAIQEKTASPLAAAGSFVSSYSIPLASGRAAHVVASSYSQYDLLVATNLDLVYGVGGIGQGSLGGPTGLNPSGLQQIAMAFLGIILWNNSNNGPYWRTFASPTWTQVSGSFGVGGTPLSKKFMVPFLDFCAMADNSNTGTSGEANHIVRKIDKSLLMSVAFDLGPGWNQIGMENYNNRYLAVAASYAADNTAVSALSSDVNFLYLWDGYAPTFNTAIRIPGSLIEMRMVGADLYFVVLERANQYALYILNGQRINRVFAIAIDNIKTLGSNYTNVLFNYANFVGINLNSKGQYIYGGSVNKDAKFILTPSDNRIVQRAGAAGTLYASPDGLEFDTYTTATPSSISYKSQWMDFDNLAQIVVNYATPPQSSGDTIQVTLDGFDEDGNATTALPLTVINSTNFYNAYKTPLDCKGFDGKIVRVSLTTTSATNWQPIIRSLDLTAS